MKDIKKESYELAIKIQKQKPWNYFADNDPIYISLPNRKDLFIVILGASKKVYGVSFYEGEKGLASLLDMVNSTPPKTERETFHVLATMNNITLYFDTKEDIDKTPFSKCLEKDYKDQDGKVPYFVHFENGYFPHKPDAKMFKKLRNYLQILFLILEKTRKEGFEQHGNEILGVIVDKEPDLENDDCLTFVDLPFPRNSLYNLDISCKDPRLKKCKKEKRHKGCIIVDGSYLKPMKDAELKKVIFPYLLILLSEEGRILNMRLLTPNEDLMYIVQDMVIQEILNHGIPEGFIVRRRDIEGSLSEIADVLGLDFYDSDWDAISQIYEEISNSKNNMH